MPKLLANTELRERLKIEYNKKDVLKESKRKRKKNIASFLGISRDSLKYGVKEKRILLYETLKGEKIYIQYPGKESTNKEPRPLDFRPELETVNGTFMQNITFGYIWDILDEIGRTHNGYLCLIAALIIKEEYMYDYQMCNEQYESYIVDYENNKVSKDSPLTLEWYKLNLDDDVWFTLNDKVGDIKINPELFMSI